MTKFLVVLPSNSNCWLNPNCYFSPLFSLSLAFFYVFSLLKWRLDPPSILPLASSPKSTCLLASFLQQQQLSGEELRRKQKEAKGKLA